MERVTVIMPVYNGAKYIAETLENIQKQDYKNISTIIVDDGCTDNTIEIARKFPNITVIAQKNAGPPTARNTGITAAPDGYLAFLDQDDLWAPDKTSKQIEIFNTLKDIKFVGGWVEQFYSGNDVSQKTGFDQNKAYTQGSLLVRKVDFLKVGFLNPALRLGDFIDWRSRAISMGYREYILEQVVLYRRIHKNSATKVVKEYQQDYLATVIEHLKRKKNHVQSSGNHPL